VPEAFTGGAIGLVRDGDMIEIDVPDRRIDLLVDGDEMNRRRGGNKAPHREMTPFLLDYRRKVLSRR
ncbi:MAG: dihydroxy-acid dehydratase, partial [Thermoplasmatota archaeon]